MPNRSAIIDNLLKLDRNGWNELRKQGLPVFDGDTIKDYLKLREKDQFAIFAGYMFPDYDPVSKGNHGFREGQHEIITAILKGKDCMCVLPTGGGKSLCYQFPTMLRSGTSIVIEPTTALTKDQVENLRHNGIKAEIYSVSSDPAPDVRFLYASPEHFSSPFFAFMLRKLDMKIQMVIVDEAHCISLWGNDFRPDYLRIGQTLKNLNTRPQVTAFTATATKFVKDEIISSLYMRKDRVFSYGISRVPENISIEIRTINPKKFETKLEKYQSNNTLNTPEAERYLSIAKINDKYPLLLKTILKEDRPDGSMIIFCSTVHEAELLYKKLCSNKKIVSKGISPCLYHGQLDRAEKTEAQNLFMNDPACRLMVATTAFGMGVDKSNVRLVVLFTAPRSIEELIQEIGRAGRDGKDAKAVIYYSWMDFTDRKSYTRLETSRFLLEKLREEEKLTALEKSVLEKLGHDDHTYIETLDNRHLFLIAILDAIRIQRYKKIRTFLSHSTKPVRKKDLKASDKKTSKAKKSSAKLKEEINDYLSDENFFNFEKLYKDKNDSKKADKYHKFIKNEAKWPDSLLVCRSALVYDIRDGKYDIGIVNTCKYHTSRGNEAIINYTLSGKIDVFDLMIANAVYTLGVSAVTSITPKKVFRMLTGDSNGAPSSALRKEIICRLDRMTGTEMEINNTAEAISVTGTFLNLEKKNSDGSKEALYLYHGPGVFFEYSEKEGSYPYTIPLKLLSVVFTNDLGITIKIVEDSPRNILLKLLLAWRIKMIRLKNSWRHKRIRFTYKTKRNKGLMDLLDISYYQDDIKYKKPDYDELKIPIIQILNHFILEKAISDYQVDPEVISID